MTVKEEQSPVLVEDIGAIRIITINRAHRRNAVDQNCADALYAAFLAFDSSPNAKVAVLTGATDKDGHGSFCAGFDLKYLAETGTTDVAFRNAEGEAEPDQTIFDNTRGPMGPTRLLLSKPVIAAIEGHAVAGGMELALWCDLRVVAADATFGIFCRRFGVPLVDGGTLRLPRLIGQSRAMDLILTGRPVAADEALDIGLANRVVSTGSARSEAVRLAQSLVNFPQACMANDRMSVLQQWGLSHNDALANETRLGKSTAETGESVSGATAFSKGQGKHGQFK